MIRPMLALAFVTLTTDAYAQDQCMTDYTHEQWRTDMDRVDEQLAEFDLDETRILVDKIWRNVGCLETLVRPGHLARFGRQRALLSFFNQDEDAAVKWGLAARYTAPDYPWALPEDHPFRAMVTETEDRVMGGIDGATLVVPRKGAAFINGRPLLEPKAPAEVPHLIQVTDKKGHVISTWWQDGAAFPNDFIGPEGPPLEVPDWYVPVTDYSDAGGEAGDGSTSVASTDPIGPTDPVGPTPGGGGLKVVNIAAGGGLGLAAGTMYLIAGAAAGKINNGNFEDSQELKATRSRANLMVVGAGMAAAGAVGVGVTAFVAADGAGVGFNVRW